MAVFVGTNRQFVDAHFLYLETVSLHLPRNHSGIGNPLAQFRNHLLRVLETRDHHDRAS